MTRSIERSSVPTISHVLYREVLVSEVVDHFLGVGVLVVHTRDMGYSGGAVDLTVRAHDGPVGRGVDVGMKREANPRERRVRGVETGRRVFVMVSGATWCVDVPVAPVRSCR